MRVAVTSSSIQSSGNRHFCGSYSQLARRVSAGALAFLMATGVVFSSEGSGPIDRIEEDWELIITTPDSGTTAPQVTCVISPTGDLNCVHATFELNHRTQPDYSSGGMQLQVWNGNSVWAQKSSSNQSSLQHDGETVSWTQRVSLSDGALEFEILNGSSQTWGAFGGEGTLRRSVSTGLNSLGGYNSTVSTTNSGVGYAGNRVSRLALKEIRYYSGEELVQQHTAEAVVHESP